MEGIVLSFLYSLIMSMGLTGASYAEIEQAFPDNTATQNAVLYSVANDPLQNSGGFNGYFYDDESGRYYYYDTSSPASTVGAWGQYSWDALMDELGFAVVGNNVDVALENGYNPAGVEWVGTLTNGYEELIVSYYGYSYSTFRTTDITTISDIHFGLPSSNGYVAVWRWSYGDNVVYSTSRFGSLSSYDLMYGTYLTKPHFAINDNNQLVWTYSRSGYWGPETSTIIFSVQDWINQGIAVDTSIPYSATGSENVGEEYLSFGTADNPVVSVAYDPATGTTTYTYKDGTISTTPPVAIGDTISLSPSITQPLTNYIINEGDITNIYNPDAAIPSADVPFDFLSLGELLKQMFIPTVAFPYMTIYNRLMNKATFINAITLIGARLKNITPQRPEFYLYGVDVFGWIDTMGDTFTYAKNFIGFVFKIMMFFGCVNLIMRTFHVEVKG